MLRINNRGFTVLEIVVAFSIAITASFFAIATISSIQKAKIERDASLLKEKIEQAKEIAASHGGDAKIIIACNNSKYSVSINSDSGKYEDLTFGSDIVLRYKRTGSDTEYDLGKEWGETDGLGTVIDTLSFSFLQGTGEITGPDYLDYVILSSNTKSIKIVIKRETGTLYYDYELPDGESETNPAIPSQEMISPPYFSSGTVLSNEDITLTYTGKSIQPSFVYDYENVRVSGEYRAIEPGTYTITFSLKDKYTTVWADTGNSSDRTLTWTISDGD